MDNKESKKGPHRRATPGTRGAALAALSANTVGHRPETRAISRKWKRSGILPRGQLSHGTAVRERSVTRALEPGVATRLTSLLLTVPVEQPGRDHVSALSPYFPTGPTAEAPQHEIHCLLTSSGRSRIIEVRSPPRSSLVYSHFLATGVETQPALPCPAPPPVTPLMHPSVPQLIALRAPRVFPILKSALYHVHPPHVQWSDATTPTTINTHVRILPHFDFLFVWECFLITPGDILDFRCQLSLLNASPVDPRQNTRSICTHVAGAGTETSISSPETLLSAESTPTGSVSHEFRLSPSRWREIHRSCVLAHFSSRDAWDVVCFATGAAFVALGPTEAALGAYVATLTNPDGSS